MAKRLPAGKYVRTAGWLLRGAAHGRYPLYASFKVTRRCRFACEFCDIWKGEKPEMSTEDCVKVLRNLGRSSVLMVSFEGGEPWVRDDISELVQEAARQPFYLMFTTSERDLLSKPWDKVQPWIDFLEVSIDEGHRNLELFSQIADLRKMGLSVTVQTVVRDEDLDAMEDKVARCRDAGTRILLMPAAVLEGAKACFPHFDRFESEVQRLRAAYPGTITTPPGYFRRMRLRQGGCNANSIVIDSDGSLVYPCRVMGDKRVRLQETDLMEFLDSSQAAKDRSDMKVCTRQCGWYQYFATPAYSSLRDFPASFAPYARDILRLGSQR